MNTTKQFEKYKITTLINLGASVLFALLLINFSWDISILAFPIGVAYCAVTVLFSLKMILKTDGKLIYKVIKLTEYLPYVFFITFILRRAGKNGTPFFYDVITVILWFVIFVCSFLTSRKLYPKKNALIVKGWKIPPVERKFKGLNKIIFEIIDWIDALVWSIFTVLIFQIFVLQLYEIPSESMVPTFLIKDRVFVSKIDCGPKFPLTDVGFSDFRKYKRGDTIVLRNPHYSLDRKSEVKTVTSQLVYMLSLMTVNLNKDENGEMKADPLVKRITGLPGEQLVMQDGVLYVRTKDSDEFIPSKIDEKYATWNLNAVHPKQRQKVQSFPLSAQDYQKMLDFEDERRQFDLNAASIRVGEIVREISKYTDNNNLPGDFSTPDLWEYDLFTNVQQIAANIIYKTGGIDWFKKFMTSWIENKNKNRDYYQQSNFTLNVMTKLTFGEMVLRYAQLLDSGVSFSNLNSDEQIKSCFQKAETLNWYIQMLLDERNMPLFPENDSNGNPQYIPENCYFMMGDNRFNSLDLRHSYEQTLKPLCNDDKMSVTYYSMMSPQYINKKYIIGKPVFRFWPLDRLGKV
ncbi:MAG: signal peptidase I [Treponema sp.]|nr:signal peptidase I [Treponema sp.]